MSNKDISFYKSLLSDRRSDAKAILQKTKNVHKIVDSRGRTLLHYAANCANHQMIQSLIELGCDVNAQDSRGRTPLIVTVEKYHINAAAILLERKADMHLIYKDGKSLLQSVVHGTLSSHRLIETFLIQLLKESGYNIRLTAQKLHEIECPLRAAVILDDVEVTRYILDAGNCKIDDTDYDMHETALHVAVHRMSVENVKLLIEYGADVNAVNAQGFTPLHKLDVKDVKIQSFEILKMLLDRGAMVFTEKNGKKKCQISQILEKASPRFIHLLMQYDIDLCAVNDRGNTVLHYLARNRHENVFDELQGKRFNVNWRNNEQFTPLLMMVIINLSTLRFLVMNGADVNACANGATPLSKIFHIAANHHRRLEGSLSSVNFLLQHGADPQSVFTDKEVVYLVKTLKKYNFALFKPVVANVALLHDKGTLISQSVFRKIDEYYVLKEYYADCKSQLNIMKKIKKRATVWEAIDKYELLTMSEKQLAVYVSQGKIRAIVSSDMFHFESCYEDFGRERVERAILRVASWKYSATAFCDLLKLPCEEYYAVIEHIIINYLSEQDVRNLCLLVEK